MVLTNEQLTDLTVHVTREVEQCGFTVNRDCLFVIIKARYKRDWYTNAGESRGHENGSAATGAACRYPQCAYESPMADTVNCVNFHASWRPSN